MTADARLSAEQRPRRPLAFRGWWIVAVGFYAIIIQQATAGWVFSALIRPMEADLGWSRTTLVGVISMANLIVGLLSAPLGPLVDRHGARVLMTVSGVIAGAAIASVALVQAPWQYYLAFAAFGLCIPGLSSLGPATAIANWFIRKRAQAFTYYTFGTGIAGLLLTPLFARIAAEAGWRAAWLLLGLLMWVAPPLAWLVIRRRPEDVGQLPDGEPAPRAGTAARPSLDEPRWTVAEALRTRSFWFFTAGFTLVSLPGSSIFVHMAPYVSSQGFSDIEAARTLTVYGVGVLAGRPTWGFFITRLGTYRALVGFGFFYAAAITLFAQPDSLLGIYAMTILLGLAISASQQLQAQVLPDYYGRSIVGALQGRFGLPVTVTRVIAPVFLAFMFDRTGGYTSAFLLYAAATLLAGLLFVLARPPHKRDG